MSDSRARVLGPHADAAFPSCDRRAGGARMSQNVMRRLLLCWLVAGCGVRLDGGPGTTPDGTGGPIDTQMPPDPDAPMARCSGRVVYLNFEGQALTRGAPSDSTMNRASWMNITSGAAP